MQDKEMYKLFSSLDLITPPAGLRERLLSERILKKKETPVNDAANDNSVFSIIEDKRSDIAPPAAEKETETPSPSGEADKPESPAIVRRPKTFMYIGAAAACIAVIVLGTFAVSIFNKGRLTSGTESSIDRTEQIFTSAKSMYTMLGSEVFGTDEAKAEGADSIYQLDYENFLMINTDGAAIIDRSGNVKATSTRFREETFLTKTEKKIYTYSKDNSLSGGRSGELCIFAYDIKTLVLREENFCINADNAQIGAFTLVPEDQANLRNDPSEENNEEPVFGETLIYTIVTQNEDGSSESTIYRQPLGGEAKALYSFKNKKGAKSTIGVEGLYTTYAVNMYVYDVFVVYSETSEDIYAGILGDNGKLYNKSYSIMALDLKGKKEAVTAKLFDECEQIKESTFEKNYSVTAEAIWTDIMMINKSTGVVTAALLHDESEEDHVDNTPDKPDRSIAVGKSIYAIPPAEDNAGSSKYTMTTVESFFWSGQFYYTDESGNWYYDYEVDNDSSLGSKDLEQHRDEFRSIATIIARVDYDSDGKLIGTTFALTNTGEKIDMTCKADGVAVNIENGRALFCGERYSEDGATEQHILHTPDTVQKVTFTR